MHLHHAATDPVKASELPTAKDRPFAFRYDPDEPPGSEPLTLTTINIAGTTTTAPRSPLEVFIARHPGTRITWS